MSYFLPLFIVFTLVLSSQNSHSSVPKAEWVKLDSKGDVPGGRRGVRGIYNPSNKTLIFHGGETIEADFLPDTHYLKPFSKTWVEPNLTNPNPRCHHTFLLDKQNNRGLVFGGFPRNNEVWEFNLTTNTWNQIDPGALQPMPRCLHAAVISDSRREMIVYGGLNSLFGLPDLDDTWSYNLDTDNWSLVGENSLPGKRQGSVMAIDKEKQRIILFGGTLSTDTTTNDSNELFAFGLETRTWTRITAINEGPTPRQFARGFEYHGGMLVMGGRNQYNRIAGEIEFKNELWYLKFSTMEWHEIQMEGELPGGRFRHTFMRYDEDHAILLMGQGINAIHYNDVWLLDLANDENEAFENPVKIGKTNNTINISWVPPGLESILPIEQEYPEYEIQQSTTLEDWTVAQSLQKAEKGVEAILPIPEEATFYKITERSTN